MGPGVRTLLVLAAPGAEGHRSALAASAKEADLEARFVGGWAEALGVISRERPAAVLLDGTAPGVEKVCQRVRTDADQVNLPVVLFERKLSDRAFVKAFRWSADDLVSLESTAELVKRLRALPQPAIDAPPSVRGAALVAEPDETRRASFFRLLANAGFSVELAQTRAELEAAAKKTFRFCVASTALAEPVSVVRAARAAGSTSTWIFTARTSELEKVARSVAELERVAAVDALDPPENALFLANELAAGASRENRREPRSLYGTLVAFRAPGGSKDDTGFSYNVSPGGLYVRTLAPPPESQVWLELRSPGSSRRARLEGRIAWSRPFGPNARATAPPGWGVEITSMLESERSVWEQGCRDLAAREAWRPPAPPREGRPVRPPSRPPPKPKSLAPAAPATVAVPGSEPTATASDPRSGDDHSLPAISISEDEIYEDDLLAAGATSERPRPEPASPDPAPPGPAPPEPALPAAPVAEALPPAAEVREESNVAAFADPERRGLVRHRRRGVQVAALIGGVILVGGVAALVLGRNTGAPTPAPTSSGRPRVAAVVSVPATPTSAPVVPAPGASMGAPPVASSAVAATGGGLPPVQGAEEGGDGSNLNWSEGYLVVRSTMAADVYAHAVKSGPTNSKLTVKCGLRWVRLSEPTAAGPKWVSDGHTVDVACRSTTTVTIERR